MKFRQNFLIYTFISCCFILVGLSSSGYFDHFDNVVNPGKSNKKSSDEIEESYFKNVEYFLVENNQPFINFLADSLTHSTYESKVLGINPKGQIFRNDNLDPIHFQARGTQVYFDKKEIQLNNNVNVNVDNTELKSDHIKIYLNDNLLNAIGSVQTFSNSIDGSEQVLINSDEAIYRSKDKFFEYRKRVTGELKRIKKYEESLQFSTDSLDFNGLKNQADLKGNVHLIRKNFDIYANLGTIYLDNYNKKLKYYSFSDDVRLEEKVNSDGRRFGRKAFAEKMEGIMSEQKIILTGLPKVFQDKDIIKGNRIVIRENVETVEVDDANTNLILKEE